MNCDPHKSGIYRVSEGVKTFQGAVVMNVEPLHDREVSYLILRCVSGAKESDCRSRESVWRKKYVGDEVKHK